MSYNLFVVEDDSSIRDLYKLAFDGDSDFIFFSFENAEDMFVKLSSVSPDLIILDIMLPGMDGITALKKLKSNPVTAKTPVIIASAKGDEETKVKGLDFGADDYISKPFGMLELKARVRANLRKININRESSECLYSFEEIKINDAEHIVTVYDSPVVLTLKEYNLLKLLIANRDLAVKRAVILKEVWGYDFVGETRTLDMHVKSLRAKLGEFTKNQYIQTVRGVGYKITK